MTLENTPPAPPRIRWSFIVRITLKAVVLFVVFNLTFIVVQPLRGIERISLYGSLIPPRLRLPLGESQDAVFTPTLYNIPMMLASHTAAQPKPVDEFRVWVFGNSAIYGWGLEADDTIAASLTRLQLPVEERHIVFHNFGYPGEVALRDLLLLDTAINTLPLPDAVLWFNTPNNLYHQYQLFTAFVQHNRDATRQLIFDYALNLDPDDTRFIISTAWDSTLIGQRGILADWLRFQMAGFSWAATRIDHTHSIEGETDPLSPIAGWGEYQWHEFVDPQPLTHGELKFEILSAFVSEIETHIGTDRILVVNQPILIAHTEGDSIRYNPKYPRWAFDAYSAQMAAWAQNVGVPYVDMFDRVPPERFTDSLHFNAEGGRELAAALAPDLIEWLDGMAYAEN